MTPEKIMVTSSKGGIGKSTVSVGLTRALAQAGKKVLLVDCDFGNCCLDMMLGLEDEVLFTVKDRELISQEPSKVLLHPEWPYGENVYFCPAPRGGQNNPDPEELTDSLRKLEECCHPDFVILDTAAGIELPDRLAETYSNAALIVASQSPVSLRAAENTARALEARGVPFIRLVINSFEDYSVRSHERMGILAMIDQATVQTIGIVPRDRAMMLASENGKMPSPKAPSSLAFANMADRLMDRPVKLFRGMRGMKTKKLL